MVKVTKLKKSEIKKRFSICFAFHYIGLFIICTLHANFLKKCILWCCCLYKIGVKWTICPNNTGASFGNFSCNDTLLSQAISKFKPWSRGLEGINRSVEATFTGKPIYPKTNNQVWFILTVMKNNSGYTIVHLHISWNTHKCTLSDDPKLEPTYTVGP